MWEIESNFQTLLNDTEGYRQAEALQKALAIIAAEKAKSEAIIETIGEAISIQDTNFRVIFQNRKHKELRGDHLGEYCYQAFENKHDFCDDCPVAKSFADGRIHQAIQTTHGSNGTNYREMTASPLRDASGKIYAGIKVIRDLTEQKKVEAEIQRLASFMQLNPNPILELDASGKITLCNKATIEMLERIGCTEGATVFIPDGLDEILRELRTRKILQFYREIRIQERIFAENIYLAPQFDAVRIYATDVTERKEIEEALRVKQEQLEELNRNLEKKVREEVSKNRKKDLLLIRQSRQAAMGEMIGNIAHQWRQPLTIAALLIQDLAECYNYGEFTKEYLDTTIAKTMQVIHQMSQTIDDFRHFFRPDKEKCIFQVHEAIDKSLALIESHLQYHGIAVKVEIDDDAPIVGYPTEYAQVINNILTNAKEAFLERETMTPEIRINAFRENSRSVVTITDNAGGISKRVLHKIFEPYFTTKDMGTGIGLFMAKNLIEKNMKGTLNAKNVDGGTEFRIEVMCWRPASQPLES
jgi:signal transduction histidine kinase